MDLPSFSTLTQEYQTRQAIRLSLNSLSKTARLALPPPTFFLSISALTPQSYGTWIQEYVMHRLGCTPVPAKQDQGDIQNDAGEFFELKASLITDTNKHLNLVQIRTWQNITGYYAIAIDLRDIQSTDEQWTAFQNRVHVFYLTKAQMAQECTLITTTSAHGTKTVSSANSHVELRASFPIQPGDPTFDRWTTLYRINPSFLSQS